MKLRLSKKQTLLIGGIIITIAGFAALQISFRAIAGPAEEPVARSLARPVKIVKLTEQSKNEIRAYPGVVRAAVETKLAFRVGGPLIELNADIGRQVHKGEIIARIDPRDFKVNLMRLTAVLNEAQARFSAMKTGARSEDIAKLEADLIGATARMENAGVDYKRHKALLEKQVVSQAQYDGSKVVFETCQAQVRSLVQELKKAKAGARKEDITATRAQIQRLNLDVEATQNALADTTLAAPFAGVISRSHVENFENVEPGSPIVSLMDMSTVEIHTAVPEDFMVRRTSVSGLYCILEAYPDKRFRASIKEIGRKTDSAAQSYPLIVSLDIPAGIVVEPGMAGMVNVAFELSGKAEQGFEVPSGAVFADEQGNACVWRIASDNNRVTKVHVTTGLLSKSCITIVSGLNPGEHIVSAGARFLRENQPVRILSVESSRVGNTTPKDLF